MSSHCALRVLDCILWHLWRYLFINRNVDIKYRTSGHIIKYAKYEYMNMLYVCMRNKSNNHSATANHLSFSILKYSVFTSSFCCCFVGYSQVFARDPQNHRTTCLHVWSGWTHHCISIFHTLRSDVYTELSAIM